MYPGETFTNIFLFWVPTFLKIGGSLIYFYLFLIFLPLFIQIFLNMVISIARAQFKFDLRPLVDLLFFPGSILRVTIVWYVLRLYGFRFKLAFSLPDAGESASSVNRRYRGLTNIALITNQAQEEINPLKISFLVSLASYALMPVVILLLVMGEEITTGLMFLVPYDAVGPLYIYLLLAIGLGGLPVPEETLSIMYTFIYMYPQLIIATMLNLLAMLIYVPFIGTFLSMLLFLVQFIFYIFMVRTSQPVTEEYMSQRLMEEIKATMTS